MNCYLVHKFRRPKNIYEQSIQYQMRIANYWRDPTQVSQYISAVDDKSLPLIELSRNSRTFNKTSINR